MTRTLRMGALGAICVLSVALAHPNKSDTMVQTVRREGSLRRGDKGSGVRALQAVLKELGASVAIDGDFGPATRRAVRAFQRSAGLSPDGVVGPQTARKLDLKVRATRQPTIQDGLDPGVGDPEALVSSPASDSMASSFPNSAFHPQ